MTSSLPVRLLNIEMFEFLVILGFENLFFSVKLLIKHEQQKIKKILHPFFETVISQIIYLVKFLQDRI